MESSSSGRKRHGVSIIATDDSFAEFCGNTEAVLPRQGLKNPFFERLRGRMLLAFALIAALSPVAPAQTLARPGWVGSGMSAQSWFKHAVFYRADTRTFAHSASDAEGAPGTLKGLTERLDYIRNLGIDAILLEPLTPDPMGGVVPAAPVDPQIGTIEDFDELSLQASKRNLRILLTLSQPDAALARYWLTRGVAGFYLPRDKESPAVAAIRKLLPGFVGQRILITDADLAGTAVKSPANELQFDRALLELPAQPAINAAEELRAALEGSQALLHSGLAALSTDAPGLPHSVGRFAPPGAEHDVAKLMAALLLLSRPVPFVSAGQELALASPTATATMPWGKAPTEPEAAEEAIAPKPVPAPATPPTPFAASERYVPYVRPASPGKVAKAAGPDPNSAAGQELDPASVLSFYRQLIQLRHTRTSARDSDEILLDYDHANALVWVRKPANPSLTNPALVVICNLSANPLSLSIRADLTKLHLRGSFLRSVLKPEFQAVSMNLDPVRLQPYGVYIGELRY